MSGGPHRLHWQDFTNVRSGQKGSRMSLDFPSRARAEAAKREITGNAKRDGREIVATIAPIAPDRPARRPSKIAAGHPAWQGQRRMTD